MITQAEVKDRLHYEPETGIFTWLKVGRNRSEHGKEAGYLDLGGYRIIRILGTNYWAHRLAFLYILGSIPEEVDHINRTKDDNRWSNLRPATRSSNTCNVVVRRDSSSGIKGLHIDVARQSVQGRVKLNYEIYTTCKSYGTTRTKQEAIEEVTAWLHTTREEIHGEFAHHG